VKHNIRNSQLMFLDLMRMVKHYLVSIQIKVITDNGKRIQREPKCRRYISDKFRKSLYNNSCLQSNESIL